MNSKATNCEVCGGPVYQGDSRFCSVPCEDRYFGETQGLFGCLRLLLGGVFVVVFFVVLGALSFLIETATGVLFNSIFF